MSIVQKLTRRIDGEGAEEVWLAWTLMELDLEVT